MRLGAVLHDKDDGQALAGGEAGGLVPETEGGEAIVGKSDDDVGLVELARGECDSGGDVELTGEGCGLRNDFQGRRVIGRMRDEEFLLEVE